MSSNRSNPTNVRNGFFLNLIDVRLASIQHIQILNMLYTTRYSSCIALLISRHALKQNYSNTQPYLHVPPSPYYASTYPPVNADHDGHSTQGHTPAYTTPGERPVNTPDDPLSGVMDCFRPPSELFWDAQADTFCTSRTLCWEDGD